MARKPSGAKTGQNPPSAASSPDDAETLVQEAVDAPDTEADAAEPADAAVPGVVSGPVSPSRSAKKNKPKRVFRYVAEKIQTVKAAAAAFRPDTNPDDRDDDLAQTQPFSTDAQQEDPDIRAEKKRKKQEAAAQEEAAAIEQMQNMRTQVDKFLANLWGGDVDHERLPISRDYLIELLDLSFFEQTQEGGFKMKLKNGNKIVHGFLPGQPDAEGNPGPPIEYIKGTKWGGFTDQDARAVIALAALHGWKSVEVHGNVDQKRKLYLAARAQGLDVTGYDPDPNTQQLGDALRAQFEKQYPDDTPAVKQAGAPTQAAPAGEGGSQGDAADTADTRAKTAGDDASRPPVKETDGSTPEQSSSSAGGTTTAPASTVPEEKVYFATGTSAPPAPPSKEIPPVKEIINHIDARRGVGSIHVPTIEAGPQLPNPKDFKWAPGLKERFQDAVIKDKGPQNKGPQSKNAKGRDRKASKRSPTSNPLNKPA
jgi:hypothetical protein